MIDLEKMFDSLYPKSDLFICSSEKSVLEAYQQTVECYRRFVYMFFGVIVDYEGFPEWEDPDQLPIIYTSMLEKCGIDSDQLNINRWDYKGMEGLKRWTDKDYRKADE